MLKEGAARPDISERAADEPGTGRVLACAGCRRGITNTAARIEVNGAHAHTFDNPDGDRFLIGCFSEAGGLLRMGPSSLEFTWFAGYSWQMEVCGGCRQFIGWLYRAGESRFHGLILAALVDVGANEG